MRKILLFVPICLLAACGNGDNPPDDPQPADIRLESSAIAWEAGQLTCTVGAQLLDTEGQPLAGVEIAIEADSADPVITPTTATTDATGQAVFQVGTTRGETVSFQGRLAADDRALGDPLEVSFGLSLFLTASAAEPTYPGARAILTATVGDDAGPIEGIEVELQALRAGDTITPDRQATDSMGQAVFELTTTQIGEAQVGMTVVGLDLDATPVATVTVAGLSITSPWSHGQPHAVLIAPRAGLVWLDKNADLTAELPARELTSTGIDPVPGLGDSGSITLNLPLDPPEGDLYRPDPTNPDLPESFEIASYGLAIYDDLDLSGDLTPADAVVALNHADVVLTYVRGELPDEIMFPGLVLGWQYINSLHGDPPSVYDFEEMAGKHRLDIDMAPCPSGTLLGQVFVDSLPPPDIDIRLGVLMVDANVFLAGDLAHLLDHQNFMEVASALADYSVGVGVDYALDLPHPSEAGSNYRDFLVSLPGAPDLGLMVPVLYLDTDGDGAFTNDDDNLATGDRVNGLPDGPFGIGNLYLEWVDSPIPPMLSFVYVGLNPGYNVVREPLKIRIIEVVDDNTLKLNRMVEGHHTGLSFRIQHPSGLGTEEVMSGSDLSTGDVDYSDLVTSATGGFSGHVDPAQDVMVFTHVIDRLEYVDFDKPIDLK